MSRDSKNVSGNQGCEFATYRQVYRHEPKYTTHFGSLSVSCIVFCFRYDTVSGRPSRIQSLKWPIFEQIPSIFGWDMTQNGNKVETRCFGSYLSQILMEFAQIWVILKAKSCWAVLILYRIGNSTIHDTDPVLLSVSSSRYFCIASNLGGNSVDWHPNFTLKLGEGKTI